jgi:hypothetical protein
MIRYTSGAPVLHRLKNHKNMHEKFNKNMEDRVCNHLLSCKIWVAAKTCAKKKKEK